MMYEMRACRMTYGDLNSSGLDGCGRCTWASDLILSRSGVVGAKVMEKLKFRRCSR